MSATADENAQSAPSVKVIPSAPVPQGTAISERLLGGRLTHSARDIANLSGTTLERVREFSAAMGFPVRDDDSVAFTGRDLGVFAAWSELVESGAIDSSTSRSLLRAHAHLADRLGLWQVEALVDDAVRRQGLDDTSARQFVLDNIRSHVAVFERMMTHSWQRQLEALLARTENEIAKRGGQDLRERFPLNRSLGFVDMVSYTSSSAILGGALVDLIYHFEDACRTAVTEAGGRVVKMMGDAVLYIADDLPTGLNVAMELVDRLGADEEILPVRASFVRGDVFSRSGDVFGPTVNLASRLVDIAPVGKVLTDPTTAAAIVADDIGVDYKLQEFPSHELRGFGKIAPYVVIPTQ